MVFLSTGPEGEWWKQLLRRATRRGSQDGYSGMNRDYADPFRLSKSAISMSKPFSIGSGVAFQAGDRSDESVRTAAFLVPPLKLSRNAFPSGFPDRIQSKVTPRR